jgi:hypothetical protein
LTAHAANHHVLQTQYLPGFLGAPAAVAALTGLQRLELSIYRPPAHTLLYLAGLTSLTHLTVEGSQGQSLDGRISGVQGMCGAGGGLFGFQWADWRMMGPDGTDCFPARA